MAASFSCDGCGCAVEVPMVLGHVIKRDYCEDCYKKAEQFTEAEEALRKSTRDRFNVDRDLLISNFATSCSKLPDVP